jgi:UDP-2,3-diacylglucosamine pyrophosphatase LpxH
VPLTRVFSDLHLGHPASTIRDVAELFPLFANCQRVILNGDTVETCSGALAEVSLERLGTLLARMRDKSIEAVVLPGNHDPDRDGPTLLELDEGELAVTHGDICFRYGSPWSPWVPKVKGKLDAAEAAAGGFAMARTVEARAALAKAYARAFHPRPRKFTGFLGKLETISHAAWPPSTPLSILDIWKNGPERVAKWMEEFTPRAKVLVMGHTHRAGMWHRRGRWVVNTGAFHPFTRPHFVEWERGRMRLVEIEHRHGAFQPGRTVASLRREEEGWRRE